MNNMMGRVSIASRLMIGFGLLVLVIAGLGGHSIYASRDARQAFATVVRQMTHQAVDERIEKRLYQARMSVWIAVATDDQSQWGQAEEAYQQAKKRLDELLATTMDPKRRAAVQELATAAADSHAKALKLKEFRGRNGALDTQEAKVVVASALAAGTKLQTIAEPLATDYENAAEATVSSAENALALGIEIAMILGTVSVLLGIGLAIVTSRSISRPIKAMTNAMKALAGGDTKIEVPARENTDEIGEMAKAVQVFKDTMVETEHLRAEQEEQKRRSEEQQHQAMLAMADSFEMAVGDIVRGVSVRATELQATAQSMSATAEETERQSTAVAAASEQASTNVQTVASAAEELSSSIAEIGRQVASSSDITARAVEDTRRTNEQIQGLAEAAQSIGDVIKLISDIASQTDLLALNATIEAARAGDAGKGFAVVAAEVKSLANQTAKATEEIRGKIAEMQVATSRSVDAVQEIGQTIARINEIATTIASAVEEQGAATQEIARNVQQASAGTTEVSTNIVGVTKAANDTGVASTQVLGTAGELAQQSEALRSQVESFLGNIRAA